MKLLTQIINKIDPLILALFFLIFCLMLLDHCNPNAMPTIK
jgi:hypothetical protein